MEDLKKTGSKTAEEFFKKAIEDKNSMYLLPWYPTRQKLHGCGKDKPSVRKRILLAMQEFFNENKYVPVDPELVFVEGKHFGKWNMKFTSDIEDGFVQVQL